jgi:hypothetical protein
MRYKLVKFEVFIPEEFVEELRTELNKINALTVDGIYDNCMAISKVKGYWRPLEEANPYEGSIGEISEEEECKVEFSCRYEISKKAIEVIKKVHPYETPVINILPNLAFDI